MSKKNKGKKRKTKPLITAPPAAKEAPVKSPRNFWRIPLLCYAITWALYVCACTLSLWNTNDRLQDGAAPQRTLAVADFELYGVEMLSPQNGRQRFVSTDSDPQLIYLRPEGAYFTRFVFDATANHPGGEMVLYYTTSPEQTFSEKQKLWAQQAEDGSWFFDLSGRLVYAIRFDPNTTSGVVWTVNHMSLNEEKPAWAYYFPSPQPIVLLLLLPGFAAACISETKKIAAGE